jgi:putative peptidoglycan lipid II flippase
MSFYGIIIDMKINKTLKIIGSMTIITIFAKLSGLLRVSLFANLFGTSAEADMFFAASRLPTLFFELALGAAILSTFIPIFNKKLVKNKDEANLFANNYINIVTFFSFIICMLGIIFSRQIVSVMFGFDYETTIVVAEILRILFPVVIFTALAFMSVGILQSFGEFNIPAAISLVSNMVMILYFLIFGRDFGIAGIAIAMLIGWSLQFLIQIPSLIKKGFRYKIYMNFKDPAMGEVVKLGFPVLISSWVHPINVMLNVMFASRIIVDGNTAEGYIAGLDFANTLYIIGVGVFTLAVTNFIFPKLSRLNAEGNTEGFSQTVKTSISYLTYAVIPIMALFIALSTPIIQMLFEYGEFDANSVAITTSALTFYSLGMIAYSITEVLNRTFFAMRDSKTPMFASITGVLCNLALSAYLMFVVKLGIWALALSAAFGISVTAIILMSVIAKRKRGILDGGFLANLFKTIICGAGAAVTAIHAYAGLSVLFPSEAVFPLIFKIALASMGALVVYLLLCYIFQIKEQKGLLRKLIK